MKLLALETTAKTLSLAIADEGSILARFRGQAVLKHSQDLIPNIEKLFKKTKLSLADIDCLAVSIGPGSFTGLRVGVSIVKGLNMATKIPIVAVPTLDAIACNSKDAVEPVCVIRDAKKKNLYTSLYKFEKGNIIRLWDYLLIPAEEIAGRIDKDIIFTGDGVALYGDTILEKSKGSKLADSKRWFPDVDWVARLGIEKLKNKEFENPDTLVPMYIYSKECSIRGI